MVPKHSLIFIMVFTLFSSSQLNSGVSSVTASIFDIFNRSKPNVTYILYNKDYRNETLIDANEQEWESKFVKDLPCVFVTHGWVRSALTNSVQAIVRAYLNKTNVNIVAIDWSKDANNEYLYTASLVPKIGEIIGEKVNQLVKNGVCDLNSTHLIGHSLGAHIMGFAGKTIQDSWKQNVSRITGLDPSGPTFTLRSEDERLAPTDANFVDAIHTDNTFGTSMAFGQADFYPNDGRNQPSCFSSDIYQLCSGLVECFNLKVFCSHLMAPVYYAKSLYNETTFPSTKCESYANFTSGDCTGNEVVYMGYPTIPSARGKYYLTVKAFAPDEFESP